MVKVQADHRHLEVGYRHIAAMNRLGCYCFCYCFVVVVVVVVIINTKSPAVRLLSGRNIITYMTINTTTVPGRVSDKM